MYYFCPGGNQLNWLSNRIFTAPVHELFNQSSYTQIAFYNHLATFIKEKSWAYLLTQIVYVLILNMHTVTYEHKRLLFVQYSIFHGLL